MDNIKKYKTVDSSNSDPELKRKLDLLDGKYEELSKKAKSNRKVNWKKIHDFEFELWKSLINKS